MSSIDETTVTAEMTSNANRLRGETNQAQTTDEDETSGFNKNRYKGL
jgi:hypothetical protein